MQATDTEPLAVLSSEAMGRPQTIDRDALHAYLWKRTDRRGALKLLANVLALEIGVSAYHFSRILAEMQEDGRLREVSRGKHNVRTYMVVDPDEWAAERDSFRTRVAQAQSRFADA